MLFADVAIAVAVAVAVAAAVVVVGGVVVLFVARGNSTPTILAMLMQPYSTARLWRLLMRRPLGDRLLGISAEEPRSR